MTDPRETLRKKFEPTHRYANFGNLITRMRIREMRCHKDTILEIQSPIIALCGLNGTGKSTILQLAAVAYKNPGEISSYYIRDFMVVGILDPNPFSDDATIEYRFSQNDHKPMERTLSRNANAQNWNGYNRRTERRVFFTGIGQYLPKIEQRDFIISKADKLKISKSETVTENIKKWICNILACSYEDITTHSVTYDEGKVQRSGTVVAVQRSGKSYSEAHMGYGEGRTQFLISAIENLPDRSLILIEEPETSLHPSAQYQLGQYLMDVVLRKQHQIFLTTHSPFLLKSLPTEARVYLKRTEKGIDVMQGLSAAQIRSLLAEGKEKALDVLVEDDCALVILRELIRKADPSLLQTIDILPAGAHQNITMMVKALNEKLPIVAVLDGDQNPDRKNNIFCLPGPKVPPEKLLFEDPAIKRYVQDTHGISLDDFSATISHLDHHGWLDRLAENLSQSRESLLVDFARVFAQTHDMEAHILTEQIKDALK